MNEPIFTIELPGEIQNIQDNSFIVELPTGAQGIKGDTGEQGPANTLSIGSVEKGENASAIITGESPHQLLSLILPKGDQGEQGIQGEKGDKGDPGIQGIQGPQGIQGVKGDTGPKGDKGDPGNDFTVIGTVDSIFELPEINSVKEGTSYFVGNSTPRDVYTADKVKGEWINQGPLQGPKGDTGPQGPAGQNGSDGQDGITPHIGENGNWFLGTSDTGKPSQGPQGIKGDKGDVGETGPQGIQGVKGDTGATGPANTLSIGTVTSGNTASATITGEAPNQELNLVLPKGEDAELPNTLVYIGTCTDEELEAAIEASD